MDPDTQEALSHQHSHGVWVVALENGKLAIFSHPNGKLVRILPFNLDNTNEDLRVECVKASLDREARYRQLPADLAGIEIRI